MADVRDGETALADPLTAWFSGFEPLEPYTRDTAMTRVVVGLTYFSVVVGEPVPKQPGLLVPEKIASSAVPPMNMLSRITRPLVWLLQAVTDHFEVGGFRFEVMDMDKNRTGKILVSRVPIPGIEKADT